MFSMVTDQEGLCPDTTLGKPLACEDCDSLVNLHVSVLCTRKEDLYGCAQPARESIHSLQFLPYWAHQDSHILLKYDDSDLPSH